jgi:hypothetical protein
VYVTVCALTVTAHRQRKGDRQNDDAGGELGLVFDRERRPEASERRDHRDRRLAHLCEAGVEFCQ